MDGRFATGRDTDALRKGDIVAIAAAGAGLWFVDLDGHGTIGATVPP